MSLSSDTKGAQVIVNYQSVRIILGIICPYLSRLTRAVQHDEEIYKDGWTFRPERFLDPAGKVIDDTNFWNVFGYGRRCV